MNRTTVFVVLDKELKPYDMNNSFSFLFSFFIKKVKRKMLLCFPLNLGQ